MARLGGFGQLATGLVLIGAVAFGGAGLVVAQDDAEEPDVSHPSHIHAGTCDELDPNPAAPLNNVEPRLNDSDDEDANQPEGVLTAPRVLYADSEEVDLSWEDMMATSHAVNVHLSDEEISTYIACGDIGGVVVDDQLTIALEPQNDSGYHGIAILEQDEDGNVDVEIYLAEPADESDATPVS
jgi:hypothetical protein